MKTKSYTFLLFMIMALGLDLMAQCCNYPCSRNFKHFKDWPKDNRCIINFNCDTVYYDMAHDDTTFKIVSKNDFLLIGQGRIYSVGGVIQDFNEVLYFFKRKEDN